MTVVGLARSGIACAQLLDSLGARVSVTRRDAVLVVKFDDGEVAIDREVASSVYTWLGPS